MIARMRNLFYCSGSSSLFPLSSPSKNIYLQILRYYSNCILTTARQETHLLREEYPMYQCSQSFCCLAISPRSISSKTCRRQYRHFTAFNPPEQAANPESLLPWHLNILQIYSLATIRRLVDNIFGRQTFCLFPALPPILLVLPLQWDKPSLSLVCNMPSAFYLYQLLQTLLRSPLLAIKSPVTHSFVLAAVHNRFLTRRHSYLYA